MTKIEAISEMVKGKKVRLSSWKTEYLYLTEDGFQNEDGKRININLYEQKGWETYIKPVDISEAFEALLQRRKVQCLFNSNIYHMKENGNIINEIGYSISLDRDKIKSKWVIL